MSRADGVLVVSLTFRWWDMIESGEKLEEYRGVAWADRVLSGKFLFYNTLPYPLVLTQVRDSDFHVYHTLRAQRGYTGVWLERKIRRIRWGTPRPEWSGDTVTGECFVIELEPVA